MFIPPQSAIFTLCMFILVSQLECGCFHMVSIIAVTCAQLIASFHVSWGDTTDITVPLHIIIPTQTVFFLSKLETISTYCSVVDLTVVPRTPWRAVPCTIFSCLKKELYFTHFAAAKELIYDRLAILKKKLLQQKFFQKIIIIVRIQLPEVFCKKFVLKIAKTSLKNIPDRVYF